MYYEILTIGSGALVIAIAWLLLHFFFKGLERM
jgi:hypothetical protein